MYVKADGRMDGWTDRHGRIDGQTIGLLVTIMRVIIWRLCLVDNESMRKNRPSLSLM